MIDGLLDGAEVVCATTVGSGSSNPRVAPISHRPWWTRPRKRANPAALCPSFADAAILFWWATTGNCHPPCISDRATEGGLGPFACSSASSILGLPTHMLTTQYRMHPSIREFPGARFLRRTDSKTAARGLRAATSCRISSGRIGTVQSPSCRWTARRNWTQKALVEGQSRPGGGDLQHRSATFLQQATSKVMTSAW